MNTRRLRKRARIVPGVAALALTFTFSAPGNAQLSIYNLVQAQVGNVPDTPPTNRTDLYDQLDLAYGFDGGRLGLRFESDQNSEELYGYRRITQRYAEWSASRLRVRVGNFYTIVGRGIVHRSFELPGVVFDKAGARSSYAPSRDLDGVLVEGRAGPVEGLLFGGKPNGGEFSPGLEPLGIDRYRGQLGGGQIAVRALRDVRVGAGYVRSTTDGVLHEELATGFLELDPLAALGVIPAALPLYLEYAHADGSTGDWFRFGTGDDTRHALYASANLLWGAIGLSGEWKDYVGFRLGTNDPPSLVREHGWTLLNRNTHVLDASGEQGFQVEGSASRPGLGSFTVNVSRAEARGFLDARFDERYIEAHAAPDPAAHWEATLFYDEGRDESVGVTRRRIVGGGATARFAAGFSLALDAQTQSATRPPGVPFEDQAFSLTAARTGWGSAAASWERALDPEQESPEDALTPGVQSRHFVAGIVNVQVSERHQATLFYGERRGGRACTAGTCYEVLAFKGAELRLTSRF